MGFFNKLYDSIGTTFNWTKKESDTDNYVRIDPTVPVQKDYTNLKVSNRVLTKGLYYSEYDGFKLSSGLAKTMIDVPVYFMGFPRFKVLDEQKQTQEILDEISKMMIIEEKQTHIESHREGSIWIFPKFDSKSMKLIWELIHDNAVINPITSLDTGEIIKIFVEEQITINVAVDKTETVTRERIFTKEKIIVRYKDGNIPSGLKDKTMRNVLGIMPIPFTNDKGSNEIRGHSDYGPVLSDLKSYNDVSFRLFEDLSNFRTKQIQTVKNAKLWLATNGLTAEDIKNYPVLTNNFIINIPGETTEYIHSNVVVEGPLKALKNIFRKFVESTFPEIIYGIKTEGNANTAEEQMATFLMKVEDKRTQKNDPYTKLMSASARLLGLARNITVNMEGFKIIWNDLDGISEIQKAEMFKNFSLGMKALHDSASATDKQVYAIWMTNFPNATEEDFKEWKKGYANAAVRPTVVNGNFTEVMDAAGILEDGVVS